MFECARLKKVAILYGMRISSTTIVIALSFVLASVPPNLLLAADQSSTNYQIEQTSTTTPVRGNVSSGSYSVDSSVSPIIGTATSGSFIVNSNETQPAGTATPPPTPPPTTTQTGGGGGGAIIPSVPVVGTATLTTDTTCPFYRSSTVLDGAKGSSVDSVEINGTTQGIQYPNTTSWTKTAHALVVGNNSVKVVGVTGSTRGTEQDYTLVRKLPGDINSDGRVDDFDLSILVSKWSKNYCQADFNRDGIIDDFDLSVLVSAWTR